MSWVNLRLKVSRCAQHCVIQSLRVSSRGSDLKWHRTYYCIYWVFPTFMLTTRKVSGMLHSSVVERCTRGLQHIPLVPVSITQGTYFQRMRRLNFGIVSRGMWRKTALFDCLKSEQSKESQCVWEQLSMGRSVRRTWCPFVAGMCGLPIVVSYDPLDSCHCHLKHWFSQWNHNVMIFLSFLFPLYFLT